MKHPHNFKNRFFRRCIQWPLEDGLNKLLNWPIFYPYIKTKSDGTIDLIGVIPSFAYFGWILLGLILPILPFLIYLFLPPNTELQTVKTSLEYTLIGFALFPLLLYIMKIGLDFDKNKNTKFILHFDPRGAYLIIAILFTLIFIFLNIASLGGHLMDNEKILDWPTLTNINNLFYVEKFMKAYTCINITLLILIFYILYCRNLLFFSYPRNYINGIGAGKSSLKAIFEASCPSKRFSFRKYTRYIPTRHYRGNNDFGQVIERLCLSVVFVRDQNRKKTFFKPLKIMFFLAPIILPYITLGVSVWCNVFNGVKAEESLGLIIWLSIMIWGLFSMAYYHWLYLVYLEPLFSHNDRKRSKVEIKQFEYKQFEQAAMNSFTGPISTISQFIMLTALAALNVYFNYLAY